MKDTQENEKQENFRLEELHKASLTGLVENSRELDKIILGLSVGTLGFLLTFLIDKYSFYNDTFCIALIFFILAVSIFAYTIYSILIIFYKNNEYFKLIIQYQKGQDSSAISNLEKNMNKYDKQVKISFFISIIFSLLFIIVISINKNIVEFSKENKKENKMQEKKFVDNKFVMINDSATDLFKSSQQTSTTQSVNTNNQTQGEKSVSGLFSSSQNPPVNTDSNTNQTE